MFYFVNIDAFGQENSCNNGRRKGGQRCRSASQPCHILQSKAVNETCSVQVWREVFQPNAVGKEDIKSACTRHVNRQFKAQALSALIIDFVLQRKTLWNPNFKNSKILNPRSGSIVQSSLIMQPFSGLDLGLRWVCIAVGISTSMTQCGWGQRAACERAKHATIHWKISACGPATAPAAPVSHLFHFFLNLLVLICQRLVEHLLPRRVPAFVRVCLIHLAD